MSITPKTWILVLFLSIFVVLGMYFLFYDEEISITYNSKTPCELDDPDFMEIIMVAANGSGDYKIICREKTKEEKQNIIFVPIDVYIIKYNDNELSSARDKENINSLFSNVNKIWNQATISADITKIEFLTINDNSIYSSTERLYSYVIQTGNYDKNKINAYFVETLHGSNGIALPGNVIMVADRTTVFDYRATSHEIGHVLGLKHVGPINRLMARGVNGFDLTGDEIEITQGNALSMFS